MGTKSMAYDHPAYTVVHRQPLLDITGKLITGSGTLSAKYTAFANLQIKGLIVSAFATATSADQWLLYRITNNGTTAVNTVTATYTIGTVGSGSYVTQAIPTTTGAVSTSGTVGANALYLGSSVSLLQGDIWYIAKGTDASATYAVDAELVVLPLANVTA